MYVVSQSSVVSRQSSVDLDGRLVNLVTLRCLHGGTGLKFCHRAPKLKGKKKAKKKPSHFNFKNQMQVAVKRAWNQ